MGADKIGNFPEADAWAATMPAVKEQFAAAFPRKQASVTPKTEADAEYQRFAKLDLSNLGM